MNNRPAFLLTGALMVVIMLISLAAFLLLLSEFVSEISPTIPDVMTDIPTLYDYDELGEKITEFDNSEAKAEFQRLNTDLDELHIQLDALDGRQHNINERDNINLQIEKVESQLDELNFQDLTYPTIRLEFYWMFAYPSLVILFIFIMFAGATYYWEKGFSIFQRGTSIKIIKTSIIGMVAIILLPEFWDIYAINMKEFSMYLIDPFRNKPDVLVKELWCKMGCLFDVDDVFNLENIGGVILGNPKEGTGVIADVLLPIFKIIPTTMITISFFVIAKIRALFIIIVIITLPIWMVCMNIPTLKKISNDMITNMIGASIAPIFSALTLSVGMGYLESIDDTKFQEWITVLGIAIFASVWPIILAPKLSIIASQTTSIVQTAVQSTAMFASNAAGSIGRSASSELRSSNNKDD